MFFRTIIARHDYRSLPPFPLPFYVRSVGHYRLGPEYRSDFVGEEKFVQVFWGIGGSGDLLINGKPYPLNAGNVAWKGSCDKHGYRATSPNWELRWFTFEGRLADAFIESYGYDRLMTGIGGCPVEHFREIERGLQVMAPYEQRRLIGVAASILAAAGRKREECEVAGILCEQYLTLVRKHYSDAQVNVNVLSDMLKVHRTTLTRFFTQHMKMSPGEYLTQFRLQRAMTLLEEGDLSIAEVAMRVGIPDPSHFCRFIKRATGRTPGKIRFNDNNSLHNEY